MERLWFLESVSVHNFDILSARRFKGRQLISLPHPNYGVYIFSNLNI